MYISIDGSGMYSVCLCKYVDASIYLCFLYRADGCSGLGRHESCGFEYPNMYVDL